MQAYFLILYLLTKFRLVLGLRVFIILLLLLIVGLLVWLAGFLVFVPQILLLCKLVLRLRVIVEAQPFSKKFLLFVWG